MNELKRTYIVHGLDRTLYARAPDWDVGTFEQSSEGVGRLVLRAKNIDSKADLAEATKRLDVIAERFRLAISRRLGRTISISTITTESPNFDSPEAIATGSTIIFGDAVVDTVSPREPPASIEQVSEKAMRWIETYAEASKFGGFPDEAFRRMYLLIEELHGPFGSALSSEQRNSLDGLKFVRNFISHPHCESLETSQYIAARLPSSITSEQPLVVGFDRTSVDHRNFLGCYECIGREIAKVLVDAAIESLGPV